MKRAALAGAVLALAVAVAPASAATRTVGSLHDARYCEIIELHGAIPDAHADVWNTIGSNRCPATWWSSLDAPSLAKERGAALVVLNGPRHFLMDSASAVIGTRHVFHGERLTQVASIPIDSAADLDQTPYLDRRIDRTNTWHWRKGRRVFELVAPGGDVYLMQSYAQIADPKLSLSQLPGLGPRLKLLPAGWRYRSRVLRKPLTLAAHGAATITMDELKNSYQLERTARRSGPRKRRTIHVDGRTKKVAEPATPGTIEDHGTLTGTPFGAGTIVLAGKFANGRFDGMARMLFARGSIVARFSLPFTISGNEIDFRGTADLAGGTGAYRGITGKALAVHDHNTLDGSNGVVTVDGRATY